MQAELTLELKQHKIMIHGVECCCEVEKTEDGYVPFISSQQQFMEHFCNSRLDAMKSLLGRAVNRHQHVVIWIGL